jgi:hypothetical protein
MSVQRISGVPALRAVGLSCTELVRGFGVAACFPRQFEASVISAWFMIEPETLASPASHLKRARALLVETEVALQEGHTAPTTRGGATQMRATGPVASARPRAHNRRGQRVEDRHELFGRWLLDALDALRRFAVAHFTLLPLVAILLRRSAAPHTPIDIIN